MITEPVECNWCDKRTLTAVRMWNGSKEMWSCIACLKGGLRSVTMEIECDILECDNVPVVKNRYTTSYYCAEHYDPDDLKSGMYLPPGIERRDA